MSHIREPNTNPMSAPTATVTTREGGRRWLRSRWAGVVFARDLATREAYPGPHPAWAEAVRG
jgi:hypothetical protein